MTTLTVGASQQYSTISAAANVARDGDTIDVLAGTYVNDYVTTHSRVNLVATGGQVIMLSNQTMASGQALLTTTTDATIDGFTFSGAHSADGSAAGLLDEGGSLTLHSVLVTANQTGLIATAAAASVLIQASEFAANGNNNASTGNIEAGAVQALTIQSSEIHDAAGDEIKSLAHTTTITGTRIQDNQAASASLLNLPNGGAVTVQTSVLEKGAASTTTPAIRFGGGAPYAGSTLTVTANTIVNDHPGTLLLQNQSLAIANVAANQLYGFTAGPITSGQAVLSANTIDATRPTLSTASLVAPSAVLSGQNGPSGAVVANGTIVSVSTAAGFGAALATAQDGDTIDLAAGTYAIAPATITHAVIIKGVGGTASFTAAPTSTTASALFTTEADVTFWNVEISGAASPGGVQAAILDQGANLTLVNSNIHDNQAGVVATAAPGASVGIFNSTIARNGTPNGAGANIAVSAIASLTLQNDLVRDAVAGPEISSAAATTTIDATRISQTAGNGAADILLPTSGQVSITNSAIEKGANSQATPLIQVGAAIHAGAAVNIVNTTLVSDLATPVTFVAAAQGASPVSVINATFVGGAPGSTQVQNAANTGAITRTGVIVNTAATASTPAATTLPAPATLTGDHGVLILDVSEDAYHGHAQFTVSIDGAQVAGTLTATANHAAGQSQAFTIAGTFAPGPHSIAVQFLNNLEAEGAGNQRDLYVDAMSFNGVDARQTAALTANGAALLATGPVARPTSIVVNLSEDAWHGDAGALITVDGKVQNGLQTVTTAHGGGSTEAMNFLLDLAPGAHTVGVTFLNGGASGGNRALYIDSMDIAGQHYAAAAATLTTNGTSTYAFTVAPPPAANAGLFLTAGLPQPAPMLLPAHS